MLTNTKCILIVFGVMLNSRVHKFHQVMSGRNYYIKINMLKITFFKHLQETEKVLEQAPREKKVIG